MKVRGKRKVAPAQPQPEPHDGQPSIAVRQCSTPNCCLFDRHNGLCSSVVLDRKRVRRAPSWMVQECDDADAANARADEYFDCNPEMELCVPCWVAPECEEGDAAEAGAIAYVVVTAVSTLRTEARRSTHPPLNATSPLPKAKVGSASQPGQKVPSSGGNKCEHGRERYTCKECGGNSTCVHGRW